MFWDDSGNFLIVFPSELKHFAMVLYLMIDGFTFFSKFGVAHAGMRLTAHALIFVAFNHWKGV